MCTDRGNRVTAEEELQRRGDTDWKYSSYINVTPVRTSPTGLDVDISQMQNSRQDPEELHLLVRLHTCS